MAEEIKLQEKYERNGWPALPRPDLKPPPGWRHSMLTGISQVFNHSLSPDGKSIAYLCNTELLTDIYTLPASGGWPSRLTAERGAIQYWWDETPRWSPDSRLLAFCMDTAVQVLPAAGGLPRNISHYTHRASSPVWMPDSRGVIISVELEEEIHLVLTDCQGHWPRVLTRGRGDDLDAQPAPDGSSIAYVHRPFNDLNRLEIRRVQVASAEIQLLAGAAGQKCWQPRWSPDGSQIAYLSQQSGFHEVWLMQADGSQARQLTHASLDLGDLAWSPDGRWLAGTANRCGSFDLVLIESRTGDLLDLRRGPGIHQHPNWSSDGTFLTFEFMSPTRPQDIYRWNFTHLGADIPAGESIQLTNTALPAMACLPLVTPEAVRYPSFDGLEIHAMLFRPARPNGAAIVHPHGGPRDQYGFSWDVLPQYLVAKGYTYLAVNYRGGTGSGAAFEHANDFKWGLGDTQDCLYGAQFLAAQPGIDPERIGIMGSSYGGYLVACCLSRDPHYRFACGICRYGDADLFNSWALCDRSTRLYTEMQLGHPAANRAAYLAGSPIHQVDRIRKPVLILHGLQDEVVPALSAEEWVEALRKADKVYEYKLYAGESHGFLAHANLQDQYQRIERFLDWYLFPG